MAKSEPTSFSPLARREYQRSRQIQAVDWTDLIDGNHYFFRHAGQRFASYVFPSDFQRPDTTTNPNYSTENTSNDFDLDQLNPSGRVIRATNTSADEIEFELRIFGTFSDVRATIFREDDSGQTQIDQFNVTQGTSTPSWASATSSVSLSDTRNGGAGGNAPQVISWTVEARSTSSSNDAVLTHIDLAVSLVSATSKYPDTLEA